MGYQPRRRPGAGAGTAGPGGRAAVGPRPRPAAGARPGRPARGAAGAGAGRVDPNDPWVVADRLLESLLDEEQRASRQRHGRWWVEVDRGWLQMGGSPHDIRFRPHGGGQEWSLCVVAADQALPPGDVWSTLLLTATAMPDTFFRVANRSAPPGSTRPPTHPPR